VRRTLGYALFVLGLALLFLGPLFRFYVLPRVVKAPNDLYRRDVTNGTGRYFSPQTLSLTPMRRLQNVTITKGIPSRSTHRVAVMSQVGRTVDLESGTPIDYSREIIAMDRITGLAANCCGETPPQDGYPLKFPFDTKRTHSYRYFDGTTHRSWPARYVRTEQVDGLTTYLFRVVIQDTLTGTIDQFPGSLIGKPDEPTVTVFQHYRAISPLWIEPRTGAIVRAGAHSVAWITDGDGKFLLTLSDTNFTESEESVRDTIDRIRTQAFLLSAAQLLVPYLGPPLGLILAAVGYSLLARPAQRVPAAQVAPAVA
jgi:hypothetical protein